MSQFIANPHFYVPQSFNLNPATQQAQVNEVAQTFRNIYFNGQHPSEPIRYNWTQFNSDSQFNFGIDRTVRYHSARQSQPIFYYKFSMDGSLNMIKRLLLLTDYEGAVHADVSLRTCKFFVQILNQTFRRLSSTSSTLPHSRFQSYQIMSH